MSADHLRIHHTIKASHANGPGVRYAIWVQGCTLACPGCFNPETHTNFGGMAMSINSLANDILTSASELEGITISGGEPFQQPEALKNLLTLVKASSNLSVLIFTGYRPNQGQV